MYSSLPQARCEREKPLCQPRPIQKHPPPRCKIQCWTTARISEQRGKAPKTPLSLSLSQSNSSHPSIPGKRDRFLIGRNPLLLLLLLFLSSSVVSVIDGYILIQSGCCYQICPLQSLPQAPGLLLFPHSPSLNPSIREEREREE